ncbi:MAG: hypothetical protein J5612_04505 [Paludibacteraceae bacterium]|nr:hypothetical protein [Paludibacteraceae bacterium]
MKQFNFSHILFALWLAFGLTQTSIVLAQDCYGDYIDDVAAISVAFYHPSTSLNATFSVSATKKVIFAGGNLQYNAAQDQWRFAEHQYDVIGDAPGSGNLTGTTKQGVSCGGTISDRATQDKWIDLFQWGTSGYRNTGYEAKQTAKDYSVSSSVCEKYDCTQKYVYQPWDLEVRGNVKGLDANFLLLCKGSLIDSSLVGNSVTQKESDWAWHNPISNGGCEDSEFGMICYNSAHQWYVPTKNEMQYLYKTRLNAHDLIAFATLTIGAFEKHGILILPDAWDWSSPGLEEWGAKWVPNTPIKDGNPEERDAKTVNEFSWSDNVLTEAEWATFESYGAVFLPAAGAMQYGDWHWYDGWGVVNEYAEYWTSTFAYSGGKPVCNTIRFNTITGLDYPDNKTKKGTFYFGGASRSPLFSCAIRPVRVVE